MPFVPVARVEDIAEGHAIYVEHHGIAAAVFNAGGGRFHALGATCPHEDGPLAEGWLEADAAVCPWHGFDFELATGHCRVNPDLSVPVYAVRVNHGMVEVDLP